MILAVYVMAFNGTKALLFLIPDSWGRISDGEFMSIKDTIAGFVAFGSIASVDVIRKYLVMFNKLSSGKDTANRQINAD